MAALELLHALECGLPLVLSHPDNAAAVGFMEIAQRFSAGLVVGMNMPQPAIKATSPKVDLPVG